MLNESGVGDIQKNELLELLERSAGTNITAKALEILMNNTLILQSDLNAFQHPDFLLNLGLAIPESSPNYKLGAMEIVKTFLNLKSILLGLTNLGSDDREFIELNYQVLEISLGQRFYSRPFIKQIITGTAFADLMQKEIWEILATLARFVSIPVILDSFRNKMKDLKSIGELDAYNKLEQIMRQLMNLDNEKIIWLELSELYEHIDFDKYPINAETINSRINWLTEFIELQTDKPKEDIKILDVACGTGDTTIGLIKNGFIAAYGVDLVDKHIVEASNKLDDPSSVRIPKSSNGRLLFGGRNNKVPFGVMKWNELDFFLEEGQFDLVLCLGRSLTHARNQVELLSVLSTFKKMLKTDGMLIIDMPNPESPGYYEFLSDFRNNLASYLGADPSILEKYFWYIVDSPDGKNFFNRFVPNFEFMKATLESAGFDDIEIVRETEIPNGKGSKNWEIKARVSKSKVRPQLSLDEGLNPMNSF